MMHDTHFVVLPKGRPAMRRRIVLLSVAIVAVLLVLVPVTFLAVLSLTARRPDNLGVRNGKLADCPSTPNCVSSQADDPEHHAEPLRFTSPPGEAWARLVRVVTGLPRTHVVSVDDAYLHAECSSAIFRFVDDVEFHMDADGQVIHFRSASRVGHSDLGVNRARIEAIRAAWEKHE
jgi:uncharacterized protein (DUF1499 family)